MQVEQPLLLTILLIVACIHWSLQAVAYKRMRLSNERLWREVGEPSIGPSRSGRRFPYRAVIWRGGHRAFGPGLDRLVLAMRVLDVTFVALGAAAATKALARHF